MRGLQTIGTFALPIIFIVLPLLTFLAYSFYRLEDQQIIAAFTFENYAKFFLEETYRRVFTGTLILAAQVMLISLLLGYPAALFIWQRRDPLRWTLLFLTILPLFMSYIIKLYAMRSILGINGFLNQFLLFVGILEQPSLVFLYNQTAVLITMAVVYLPFAILPIFLSLERVPQGLLAASADLGARPLQTFRHVILPLSLPGTIAGGLFAFILAMGDFLAPQMVGGTSGFTYGRLIQSQFGLAFNWPFGAALAVILFITAVVLIALASRLAPAKAGARGQ